MDGTYRCDVCGREEQAYKCVHLEEGTKVCCSACYFEAQEKDDEMPWKIDDIIQGKISSKTLKSQRDRYLATLRRHCKHFDKSIKETINYFINKEIELSIIMFGKKRSLLSKVEIDSLTKELRYKQIPEYFGELLDLKHLKNIPLSDYYTHRDYETKLLRSL